jgi:hypothetical protein
MTHLSRDALVAWRDHPTEEGRAVVVPHLAVCHECSAVYAELMRTLSVDAGPQHFNPADFQARGVAVGMRVLSRSPGLRARSWLTGVAAGIGRAVVGSPAPVRWALVGQFVLILVLGGGLLVSRSPEPSYATLSGGDETAGGVRLTVIFQPTATAEAIRQTLGAVGGTLVSGPSATGVYVVAVAVPDDATRVDAIIDTLRRRPAVIQFAERQP